MDFVDDSNKLLFKNTEESLKKLQNPENKKMFNILISCLLQTQAFDQFFQKFNIADSESVPGKNLETQS